MDNKKQIEAIENKIEELKQELEKLKSKRGNSKASSWEKGEYCDKYYYINSEGVAILSLDFKIECDYNRYSLANYNTDYAYLQKIAFEENLRRRMLRWADQNNECEIDWDDSKQNKYYIYYNSTAKELIIDYNQWAINLYEVYFTSREIAQEALKVFREDLEKLYKNN